MFCVGNSELHKIVDPATPPPTTAVELSQNPKKIGWPPHPLPPHAEIELICSIPSLYCPCPLAWAVFVCLFSYPKPWASIIGSQVESPGLKYAYSRGITNTSRAPGY